MSGRLVQLTLRATFVIQMVGIFSFMIWHAPGAVAVLIGVPLFIVLLFYGFLAWKDRFTWK